MTTVNQLETATVDTAAGIAGTGAGIAADIAATGITTGIAAAGITGTAGTADAAPVAVEPAAAPAPPAAPAAEPAAPVPPTPAACSAFDKAVLMTARSIIINTKARLEASDDGCFGADVAAGIAAGLDELYELLSSITE